MGEKERVEEVSSWYLDGQLDFDKRLIGFRYRTLKPFFYGSTALELGPAEGQMTNYLINDFSKLTIVDAASKLLDLIPNHPNLIKINSLFENYEPQEKFDTIFLEHILEHIEYPVSLLNRVKDWLSPKGKILIGVPNANSFHRLVACKMGMLKNPYDLNERDLAQGHRRVYTAQTFKDDLDAANLNINYIGGCFFKPLSNSQIQSNWSEDMINGFFELGKDFQYNAADIYAICDNG